MASSPFEEEDQTDEDFFDRLVNDEIDFTGLGLSVLKNDGLEEAKVLSNLSMAEVGSAAVDSGGNAGFEVDGEVAREVNEDNLASKESNSLITENRNESNNMVAKESISSLSSDRNGVREGGIGEERVLDSTVGTSSVAAGVGMKEVQWSSFGSDNNVSGAGFGSYSDFLTELGDSSEDPFAGVANMGKSKMESNVVHDVLENPVANLGASGYEQPHEGQHLEVGTGHNIDGQDSRSSHYWENLYPGWKYDANTGQWYQLEGNNANTNADINVNANAHAMGNEVFSDHAAYQLQTAQAQSVTGTAAEECTAGSVSHWNQTSQGNMHYPVHMVFDPQYPGWYYDTITGEWKLLESYIPATNQLTSIDDNQQFLNQNVENQGSQSLVNQDGSAIHYNQQVLNSWQTQDVANIHALGFTENRKSGDYYSSISHLTNSTDQQSLFNLDGSLAQFEHPNWNVDGSNKFSGFQGFIPGDSSPLLQSQTKKELNQHMHFSPAHFDSQKSVNFSQHPLHGGTQLSHVSKEGRSSEGRPPHALVTFGFGGKLVFMKCSSPFHKNSYGSQDSIGGAINVLNLMEVVVDQTDPSNFGWGAHDYFHALRHQSFPGPLVGGNFGNKELNKWIDEKISECESLHVDDKKGEVLRLLFSLLKIACQYYGKLRSPFGTHQALKESDCPESAVAKLFAFSKRKSEYGALAHCLQNLPSEAQIQASAREVQNLLVSGRKMDALQCAQEGHLWGLALVLSSQLGDQVYGETVKQMALSQFVVGTPLRTLCLLAAGQPADVFSSATTWSSLPSSVDKSQQPVKIGANCMLDEWEENLAIMTANRTKNDELVIIHLGDCLWKEHGEATAAHICYLVAEANFEPYTDSARLCLIGADHWKFPRTYASPEAIQRTELYEYSKVLGNSQFLLLPFQPYKLIYAHMLAEVGKVADALKYCQAILKSLKTSRAPDVDMWRQLVLSLEERIRMHQQGGYGTDLAPTKLGKLLTFFDSTAHRVVGGLPPPVPSTSHSSSQQNELAHQPGSVFDGTAHRVVGGLPPPAPSTSHGSSQQYELAHQPDGLNVSSSQSTMAMSTLMPSVSMEAISEWTGESKTHNRSISEPDFGRSPKKVDSIFPSAMQPKASTSGGSSRFGRFGSQLYQKTVGLVLRSQPDRQAKLGEKNRFYYDEKLKRWVEEGAEPPTEEAVLPPPPTTGAFQNVMKDYNMKNVAKTEVFPSDAGQQTKSLVSSEQGSEIPPMPSSSNQFTARGRIGVRSRYVDTFNKGNGTSSNFFQSPSIAATKPGGGSNPKFFIPSPVAYVEGTVQTPEESVQETTMSNENPPTSFKEDLFSSQQTSTLLSTSLQRFPSLDDIVQKRGPMEISNGLFPPPSRRAASWSGSLCDARNPSMINEIKPSGEVLAVSAALKQPGDPLSMQFSTDRNGSADDLHEVEL